MSINIKVEGDKFESDLEEKEKKKKKQHCSDDLLGFIGNINQDTHPKRSLSQKGAKFHILKDSREQILQKAINLLPCHHSDHTNIKIKRLVLVQSNSTRAAHVSTVSSGFIAAMCHFCSCLELEEMRISLPERDLLVQISAKYFLFRPFCRKHEADNGS